MRFVEDLPAETRGVRVGAMPAKYPWNTWLDGNAREAKRGVDYTCADNSFRTALHAAAQRRKGAVRTLITDRGIQFQFFAAVGQ